MECRTIVHKEWSWPKLDSELGPNRQEDPDGTKRANQRTGILARPTSFPCLLNLDDDDGLCVADDEPHNILRYPLLSHPPSSRIPFIRVISSFLSSPSIDTYLW